MHIILHLLKLWSTAPAPLHWWFSRITWMWQSSSIIVLNIFDSIFFSSKAELSTIFSCIFLVNWRRRLHDRLLSLGPFTYYVITEKGAGMKIIKSLYFIIEKKWAGGKNPKIVTTLYVNGPIRVWPCSKFGNIVCRKVSNFFL